MWAPFLHFNIIFLEPIGSYYHKTKCSESDLLAPMWLKETFCNRGPLTPSARLRRTYALEPVPGGHGDRASDVNQAPQLG